MEEEQVIHAIATAVLADSVFYARMKSLTIENLMKLLYVSFPQLKERYWFTLDIAYLVISAESQDEFLKGLEKLAK